MENEQLPITTIVANKTIRQVFRIPIFEKVLLKFYQQVQWKFLLRFFPDVWMYPHGTIRSCERNGVWFDEIDIGLKNGWGLYYFRSNNGNLVKYAHPGDIVFDIGANQGETALYFAKTAGKNGQVYAFEPNAVMLKRMEKNFARNRDLNCTAIQVALGAEEGTANMRQPDERHPGGASIASGHFTFGVVLPPVKIITLDQFVEQHGINHVDFIKVDVEGYEIEVLKGGRKAIARWKPRLLVEVYDGNQRNHNHTGSELIALLEEYGYHIINAQTGGIVMSTDDLYDCRIDVYCTP